MAVKKNFGSNIKPVPKAETKAKAAAAKPKSTPKSTVKTKTKVDTLVTKVNGHFVPIKSPVTVSKSPKAVTWPIHVQYTSLAWQNGDSRNSADIMAAAARGGDFIGFDELKPGYKDTMRDAGKKYGYQVVNWPGNGAEEGFLIKSNYPIKSKGRIQVSDAVTGSPARWVNWVQVGFHGIILWLFDTHWLDHVNSQGHVVDAYRAKIHAQITDALIKKMKALCGNNAEKGIGICMGDVNDDLAGDITVLDHRLIAYKFKQAGIKMIWSDEKVFPVTLAGHGSYDMIARFDPQNRMNATGYKVWPKQQSDHRPISAYYDVLVSNAAGAGGSAPGGDAVDTTPAPFYPAWWGFDDYEDDVSIYEITEAVDDNSPTHADT